MVGMLRKWRCKLTVEGTDGKTHEAKARVDIRGLTTKEGMDLAMQVLFDPQRPGRALMIRDLPRELGVSAAGELTVPKTEHERRFARALVRSLLPVAGSYAAAAIGTALFGAPVNLRMDGPASPWLRAGMVAAFTLTHVAMATLLFSAMLNAVGQFTALIQRTSAGLFPLMMVRGFKACTWFVIIMWFGLPMAALGWLTGWLSVVWQAVHVGIVRRDERAWTFLEYGSTSLALLLFIVCFSGVGLFPWGLAACAMQAVILAVPDLTVRRRWMRMDLGFVASGSGES
jgi:hypothetical protein